MSARPDLSGIEDKELHELGAAIYDMNAAMLRLAYCGLINVESEESVNISEIMDAIDSELRMRLAMKRAIANRKEQP